MPDTKDVVKRHDTALERIAKALNLPVRDLRGDAPGNPQLERAIMLENVASQVERVIGGKATGDLREAIRSASDDVLMGLPGVGEKSLAQYREWADSTQEMPAVIETVAEKPLTTTETVETTTLDAVSTNVTGRAKG